MAQLIYGIDLGSYLVKVAVQEVGFRSGSLRQVVSVPVAEVSEVPPPLPASSDVEGVENAPPSPAEIRAAATTNALRTALARAGGVPDVAVLALPGDLVNLRNLEFPFSDTRKVLSVLNYELEGQIPYELDEVVFDQLISVSARRESEVVVAMAHVRRAAEYLKIAQSAGLDPTVLSVASLSYGYLGDEGTTATEPTYAVLDIGHRLTNFAVLRGQQTLVARTLSRGGWNITRGLADRYEVSVQRAAELKHTYASIPYPGGPTVPADQQPIVEVVQTELAPLVSAVRQSLLQLKQTPDRMPQRLVICGGSSVISGLRHHLEHELELPVASKLPAGAPTGVGARGQVLAVGLAQVGANRRLPSVNLRRGALAVMEARSLLSRRSLFITWSTVAVLSLLVLAGFTSLWTLQKEQKQLRKKLVARTTEILQQPMNDPEIVDKKINRALNSHTVYSLPIPASSAYGVLSEISRRVPAKEAVTLNVTRLFIRKAKIDFEGTAKSATEVENVVKALEKIPCFKKVQQGRASEVNVREMIDGELKTDKRIKFTVDIAHDCI
ncbi:MAG: pilus assembly protein PilM [bacterium]